jgi:AAHS family 4-hydroxybenzoate transporter-like MFS transporter
MQAKYTVSEIVERQGFSGPVLKIIALCFLLLVCDSYDVAALSFAAPALIKLWAISPQSMGLVFSVGLFGLLIGSILFGRMGDSIGRKRSIVIGALAFGVLTLATGFATSYNQLVVLRFLAALGLGGAIPNAVALVTEFSPKALRITSVGIIFAGYSVGGICAGFSAAVLIGGFGWSTMFFVGGGISLIAALAIQVALPESLLYLTMTASRQSEAAQVAAILRPDLLRAPDLLIVRETADAAEAGRLKDLFVGPLRIATPLLWLIYIASSMTVFFLSSWMPVAVESVGFSRSTAAIATALLFTGSAVGGVVGGRFSDRFGISAVIVLEIIAIPVVAALGALGGIPELLLPMCFLAGCFAFGAQTCLHGIAGSFYPTSVRANGVGWAIGIAKIGSIAGPFIGGLLLPSLSGQGLFLAATTPLIVVVCLSLILRTALSHERPATEHFAAGHL